MSIEWDHKKRKEFRLALQRVFPSYEEFELFVSESIDENLAERASNKRLSMAIGALLYWAMTHDNKLNELFEAFCEEQPGDPVISQIKNKNLVGAKQPKKKEIDEQEWNNLFECLFEDDLPDLKRAFKTTIRATISPQFQGIELFSTQLNSVLEIREELERLDSCKFAVQFMTEAIAQISRSTSTENRDLTALIEWRDRIANRHGIDLKKIPETITDKVGYLLVSIKSTGQSRKGIKEVMLFPEIHIDESARGQESLEVITCATTEIGRHLSKLLYDAEERLNCEEVTLELFLAWPQVEEHTADWDAEDVDGNLVKLKYQRYILRSLDRLERWEQRSAFQTKLKNNWQRLEAYMNDQAAHQTTHTHFHCQIDCPEPGQLTAALSKKVGLKLISRLPEDYDHRKAIFNNIIESAVPVAFWIDNTDDCEAEITLNDLNVLLQDMRFTHFGAVAESLMQLRSQRNHTACQLRSLFDCPDRWPQSIPRTESAYEDDSSIVSPL